MAEYDLFVVHADADREWVDGFLIPALGLAPERFITPDTFILGRPKPKEFERAVKTSRVSAMVLTPAFLDDAWSAYGEELASFASTDAGQHGLVPILLQPCELPLGVDFRVRLDFTDANRWEDEVARLRALLERPPPPDEADVPCPYPGLHPFSREQSKYFRGRDEEIADLARRLRRERRIVIIGPSGSGKSSLVFAGLLPELERVRRQELLVRSFRPGPAPVDALAACLECPVSTEATIEDVSAVGDVLARNAPARDLLIVVDQLEEVFAQAPVPQQEQFFAALAAIGVDAHCSVVFTARADFYAELMACPLWPLAPGERFELVPLGGERLRPVIVEPAQAVGVQVEPALVERLLRDAAGEPGALPLMQETLVLLWRERRRRLLTADAYDRLGGPDRTGLAVALATAADAALGELSAEGQAMARGIFLRLVQLNEGRADTRRQQSVAEIDPNHADPVLFGQTLQHLTAHRLVTVSGESDRVIVDFAHEALITAWPTLRSWIAEARQWLPIQRQLSEAAKEWQGLGRDRDTLYRGSRLRAVAAAAEGRAGDLTRLEREFLEASKSEDLRVREEELARASLQAKVAQGADEANLRRGAEEVLSVLPTRPRRALTLAVGLVCRSLDTLGNQVLPDVQESLHAAALTAKERRVLPGHRAPVRSVTVSPDGRIIASGSEDRTVRLWTIDGDGLGAPLSGHDDAVTGVAFSPDGRTIASSSADGTVRLWDINGKSRGAAWCGHEDAVTAVAFSPDGRTLASAGDDATVQLWDTTTGGIVDSFDLGTFVNSVAFSPDGRLVAAGDGDGTVVVREVGGAERSRREIADGEFVSAVAFAPLESMIAVARGDGTVQLLRDGGEAVGQPIEAHEGFVNAVVFTPGGTALATAGHDRTARLWNLDGRPIHAPLVGHAAPVTSVAVSADLTKVVTGSGDFTVRIWDWQPVPVRARERAPARATTKRKSPVWDANGDQVGPAWVAHEDFVASVALAPDGRTVASCGGDRTVRFWTADGEPLAEVRDAHEGSIMAVAFSPDGRVVASGAREGSVRLWDPRGNPIGTAMKGSSDDVVSVAFAPDGRTLAAAGAGATVRLWDLYGRLVTTVEGHEGDVRSVAFAPEDSVFATASMDGTARVWDGQGNAVGDPLRGDRSGLVTVAFSPDGQLLATGGADGAIWLWHRNGERAVEPIQGHREAVNAVRFSPDGDVILSAGSDGALRLWDLQGNPVGRPLVGHHGAVWSADWHPDGASVVSGGTDGTLRMWQVGWRTWLRLACERLTSNAASGTWPDDELTLLRESCGRTPRTSSGPQPS